MTPKEYLQQYRRGDYAIRGEIIRTISAVDEEILQKLLIMRYVRGYGWQKIALEMNFSRDHVVGYLHRRALKKIQKIRKIRNG